MYLITAKNKYDELQLYSSNPERIKNFRKQFTKEGYSIVLKIWVIDQYITADLSKCQP
jgi:hypothetical protein